MKYLFCPLASPGYVFPAIAIARELTKRGHEVAFVTDPEYGEILAQEGFSRIPRGAQDGPSFQVPYWFKPLAVAMQFRHIEYAMGVFRPDVLVASILTLGPLFARELFGIPCAVIGLLPYLWPTADDSEPLETEAQLRRRWRYGETLGAFNNARELFKIPLIRRDTDAAASPFLGDLFLQRSIPGLGPDPGSLPDRVHLVGSCLWEPAQEDHALTAWLEHAHASRQPLLYVQQARSFGGPAFWPTLVERFAEEPMWIAASANRMDMAVGELPARWLVQPHVAQGAVLARARAMIASGTTTAALGALSHGVPSLLISSGSEQPDVGELLGNAGAALHLPAEALTAERLRHLVTELCESESLRARAGSFQEAIRSLDGPRLAADLLERLGCERSPVTR
jgi:MGT family glycosyltransferase